MAKGSKGKPDDFDRPRTSPLVSPGGKVDQRAVYQATEEAARKRREEQAHPAAAIDDDDLITDAADTTGKAAASEVNDDEDSDGEPIAQRVVFKLKRDLNKRLDKYLTDRITFMSRAKLQALIEDGGVLVNGRQAKSSTCVRQSDLVEVSVPPPPSPDCVPEDIPLDVMFEDEHIIVINKTPDIIVHPARSHNRGTMINALAYHFRHRSSQGGALSDVGKEFARPGVIHRLDRQTSGVIVFAKTEQAHWRIAQQFERRSVDKRYVAFVHGRLADAAGTVDLPLGPSPSREKGHREKQVVRHDHLGKPAVTVYRLLGRYTVPATSEKDRARKDAAETPDLPAGRAMHASLVEIELKTGRTHQIRVHMASLGHPLLGDDMYGGAILPATTDGFPGVQRVALHAAMLTFRHPATDKPLKFEAPLPPDLASVLANLRIRPLAMEATPPKGTILSIAHLLRD